jgi:hypothetical protein
MRYKQVRYAFLGLRSPLPDDPFCSIASQRLRRPRYRSRFLLLRRVLTAAENPENHMRNARCSILETYRYHALPGCGAELAWLHTQDAGVGRPLPEGCPQCDDGSNVRRPLDCNRTGDDATQAVADQMDPASRFGKGLLNGLIQLPLISRFGHSVLKPILEEKGSYPIRANH